MNSRPFVFLQIILWGWALTAQPLESRPEDPSFARFSPAKAPTPAGLVLQRGDRLAVCGDSITEQKMYNSIRSGMTLVPFNAELNRMLLVVRNGAATSYQVTWGQETKRYPAEQLAQGVNLAEDFVLNPFCLAFKKVDEAVAAKQNYETRQIKDLFHGPEGRADPKMTAKLTEKVRAPLAKAIKSAFVPVNHTIRIIAE